jgi:predicted dehydrogenase
MLKIGVLGAGHLGKIHLRLLQQSEKYELVGFYDPNQENADKISKEFDTNILVQLPLLCTVKRRTKHQKTPTTLSRYGGPG